LRRLRIAAPTQLLLDLDGVGRVARRSGGGRCQEDARERVLVLLARLIARGVIEKEEGRVMTDLLSKLRPAHLSRDAYIYVRQSTLTQVREHTESLERQYELADRAMTLGWQPRQVVIVDGDLGRSGAEATAREAFKGLVADVGLGRVGIVFGIEGLPASRGTTGLVPATRSVRHHRHPHRRRRRPVPPGDFNDRPRPRPERDDVRSRAAPHPSPTDRRTAP